MVEAWYVAAAFCGLTGGLMYSISDERESETHRRDRLRKAMWKLFNENDQTCKFTLGSFQKRCSDSATLSQTFPSPRTLVPFDLS